MSTPEASAELARRLAARAVVIVSCFRLRETLADDGVVYFPSQYAVELARHAPTHWVNPPARRPRRGETVRGVRTHEVLGRAEPIGRYGRVEWAQVRAILRRLRRRYSDRELLVLTYSTVLPAPEPHGAGKRVAFVGDSFFPLDDPYLAACDLLVCSSQVHAETVASRPDLPRAIQLSMGVDDGFLARAAAVAGTRSGRLRSLFDDPERPLAAYFGTLSRADVPLLASTALLRPDVNFAVAGTLGQERDERLASPLRLPNVRFVPRYRHDEMPVLLADVDVGLIPYALDEFAVGCSPTKLFEYFALGLPVVSTDLAYPLEVAALVTTVATPDQAAAAIDAAFGGGSAAPRLAVARASTPTRRLLAVLRAVDDDDAAVDPL